jgi:UDP-glucose 4-epimerase
MSLRRSNELLTITVNKENLAMPEIKGSKILVTGGMGNIGSHIIDALVREGADRIIVYDNFSEGELDNLNWAMENGPVELIRADIRDPEDLDTAMRGIDYVFHAASMLLLESKSKPRKALEVNVNGTFNVFNAAVKNGVKKVIFSSSASVFGDPLRLPVDEDHPFNNVTIYGGTKIAGEQICTYFYHEHKIDFVGLRYYNVYGPRQSIKGAYAQVLPRWLDRIDNGKPLVIFGDGSQTMDMIFVHDIALANILSLKSDVTNEFFNIGTGIETSVGELAHTIMELKDYHLPEVYEPHDINLVKRRRCSTDKSERLLGFRAQVDVRTGLKQYIEWRDSMRQPSLWRER